MNAKASLTPTAPIKHDAFKLKDTLSPVFLTSSTKQRDSEHNTGCINYSQSHVLRKIEVPPPPISDLDSQSGTM